MGVLHRAAALWAALACRMTACRPVGLERAARKLGSIIAAHVESKAGKVAILSGGLSGKSRALASAGAQMRRRLNARRSGSSPQRRSTYFKSGDA
jgi:hypothetical protein